MALTQTHYRFRTDANAVDATPTWGADEDASPSPATTPFRLRLGLQSTSAASGEFEIYAQKNAGSYAAVTTSATGGVQSYDASSDADDAALLVPRLTLSSAWWLAGAAIDLDLTGNRIYPSGTFTDYLSCSRASDGYAKNSAGEWVQFSSNVLRRTDLGLLVEGARNNYLLQSGSPATQTTESLNTGSYTLWVEGSGSALASAGTATISGAASATEGSPNTFSVTGAGTVLVTVTGTLDRFQLENGTFNTSYIPTATASAARAADSITMTGSLDTLIRTNVWSFLADIKTNAIDFNSVNSGFVVNDGYTHGLEGRNSGGNDLVSVRPAASNVDLGSANVFTSGVKVALATNASGRSWTGYGMSAASDATVSDFSAGGRFGVALSYTWGYSRRAIFWNSRLADATLQSLTAP